MTPMNWPIQEISRALGEQLISEQHLPNQERLITFVETDSRSAGTGQLFVCLRGDRFDAHDFAPDVADNGVAGIISDRKLDLDVTHWVVKDTRKALGLLAKAWRQKFSGPVMAVVGSNGKTTSKEMLASVARAHWGEQSVCVTQGNLNNEIGVPLTLFRLRNSDSVAVVEMGMNHPGEIAYLASLVEPDAVLLTNAQREHQEFMKTVLAVAQENGSAFQSIRGGGVAVYPANTEFDSVWAGQAAPHRRVTFGQDGDVQVLSLGESAVVLLPDFEQTFKPGFVGRHNFENAAGVAAIAFAMGVNVKTIADGLSRFQPVNGRLKVVCQSDDLFLIDDSYNANPDSVNAAAQVLADLPGESILVLGDMGEVGDKAEQYHVEVGQQAKSLGIEALFLLGDSSEHAAKAFGQGAFHFDSLEALIEQLSQTVNNKKYNVLVKGSRFMKMERVVDALMQVHTSTDQGDKHAA